MAWTPGWRNERADGAAPRLNPLDRVLGANARSRAPGQAARVAASSSCQIALGHWDRVRRTVLRAVSRAVSADLVARPFQTSSPPWLGLRERNETPDEAASALNPPIPVPGANAPSRAPVQAARVAA